jgi:hypothetical protein
MFDYFFSMAFMRVCVCLSVKKIISVATNFLHEGEAVVGVEIIRTIS